MLGGVRVGLRLMDGARRMVGRGVGRDDPQRAVAPVEEVVAGTGTHEDEIVDELSCIVDGCALGRRYVEHLLRGDGYKLGKVHKYRLPNSP